MPSLARVTDHLARLRAGRAEFQALVLEARAPPRPRFFFALGSFALSPR